MHFDLARWQLAQIERNVVAGKDVCVFRGNLLELTNQFATERGCQQHLAHLRWPQGSVCPIFQGTRAHGPRSLQEANFCYNGHATARFTDPFARLVPNDVASLYRTTA